MVVAHHNKYLISRQIDRIELIQRIEQSNETVRALTTHIDQTRFDEIDPIRDRLAESRAAMDNIESDLLLLDHLAQPNMNLGELILELELFDPALEVITDFKKHVSAWALLSNRFHETHALIQVHKPEDRYGHPARTNIKVEQMVKLLRNSIGSKLHGEKGRSYFINEMTPMWIGNNYNWDRIKPRCVISASPHEEFIVLRTQESD